MEKIRQIKAQMQDDDGFIVETKTSFFGLVKTVTRVPKPTLEECLTEAIAPSCVSHPESRNSPYQVRRQSMAFREKEDDEDEAVRCDAQCRFSLGSLLPNRDLLAA